MTIGEIDALWRLAVDRAREDGSHPPGHPLAPLVTAWQKGPWTFQPFPIRRRASLPRFQRTTIEEARLLAAREEPLITKTTYIALPPGDEDTTYPCPSWLLEIYRRASTVTRIRGAMPWSFTILLGVLIHTRIPDRTGREGRLKLPLDDVIAWLHPQRWKDRARDWHKLERAFEELPAYRIPVGDYRFRIVVAEALPRTYKREAIAWFSVRVPFSAGNGIRIDWPRLLTYRKSAIMTRAYLSLHALLDKSAHHGHPVTRLIREPVLDSNGVPRRLRGGRIVRTDRLVENPVARYAPFLSDGQVAGFLGLSDTAKNRHDGKRALTQLRCDNVVELVEENNGYRVYGPPPIDGEARVPSEVIDAPSEVVDAPSEVIDGSLKHGFS